MTLYKWSQTAAANATADATINWAEGMSPSAVNDSARAMMAAVAKFRDDLSPITAATTGSSNAYAVTTHQGLTSLTHGLFIGFIANHTNTGPSTLNVDGLGAKPLRIAGSVDAPPGSIIANAAYLACYGQAAEQWLLVNAPSMWSAGDIKWTAVATAEVGWLPCDGSAVSRTTYAALFARIGTTYGVGDGSTTFNLPDLRGRVVAGYDAGEATGRLTSGGAGINSSVMGAAGGAQTHTLTEAQLPSHTHTGSASSVAQNTSVSIQFRSGVPITGGAGTYFDPVGPSGSLSTGISVTNPAHNHTITIGNTGSGLAHNNTQPTIVLFPVIKY